VGDPKVLVVDDDGAFRAYVRAALEDAGFAVAEVADGSSVVEAALDERPDLVLLDWRMPGESGITACRRLREEPSLRDVRVVMVTGLDDERDRALARQAGADAFIVKGASAGTLADDVQRVLRNGTTRLGRFGGAAGAFSRG
jgi:DNA-binding response OmpR family regulator